MKIQKLIFLFLLTTSLLGSIFVFTPKAFAATHVSGDINTNTTWTIANSPYVVDSDIYISNGVTFNIEPGVIVKFAPFTSMFIDSETEETFRAVGTPENKIYFTSLADDTIGGDTNGDGSTTFPDVADNSNNIWYGIYVHNGFNLSTIHILLNNVVVRYADIGLSLCRVPDVVIQDSIFEKNKDAIHDCGDSHVNISNTEIKDNKIGINLNQADYLPGSIYQVNNISIYNNTDYGVLNETHGADQARNNHNLFWWLVDLFKPNEVLADTYDYTVGFRNTWWGDPSGPKNFDTNIDALGNKVSNLVLFSPWITVDPNSTCCSNVLFLPGLEASRLYKQKTILGFPVEDQLWEPNLPSDVEDLYLNPDGTSINQNIYTRDIIKKSNTPIPAGPLGQNIYKSFSATMDSLVADQKINEWISYAYDWRQGVDDIVNNGTKYQNGNVSLFSTLQNLVDHSKNGKVTIVAHSNGGLLAKAFLKKLQDDKNAGINDLIDHVDTLILVAVPEIGTAKAAPSILNGYDGNILWGLLMNKINARELGRNMISAYGLLPSKEYINHVSASPATFVDTAIPSNVTTKMVQKFGSAINSYDEYKDFLFGNEGRINPPIDQINLPIVLSENLFTKAENLHNVIDAWTPPTGLKAIEVAGWGIETIGSFEYYPKMDCNVSPCRFILDEKPRTTVDGDGTVVVPSAQYTSFLGYGEKYWLNLFAIAKEEHSDILEVPSLLNFISNTIKNLPINNSSYITTTEPIDTENRFHISIHSPVTLDAYDMEGNHTGKICPANSGFCYVEKNIPNSSYMEFGEGKYISFPEDQMSKIKLQGTDIGTFTYESEKVLPDGTSTTSSFIDVPVTTQTEAEVTLNQTGVPQLALDVTGDGTIDFTVNPNTAFDPILFLQIMKKTIESFDISNQQRNTFTKRIDDTIKAIQKGKINKAKLKIEQFKKALVLHPGENDKDRKERENKNEREHEKERKEHKKPKKLSSTDAQLLLDMLNKLLDNLN